MFCVTFKMCPIRIIQKIPIWVAAGSESKWTLRVCTREWARVFWSIARLFARARILSLCASLPRARSANKERRRRRFFIRSHPHRAPPRRSLHYASRVLDHTPRAAESEQRTQLAPNFAYGKLGIAPPLHSKQAPRSAALNCRHQHRRPKQRIQFRFRDFLSNLIDQPAAKNDFFSELANFSISPPVVMRGEDHLSFSRRWKSLGTLSRH